MKKSQATQYVAEYEKLLLDCIVGDQSLFVSTDEVKAMWRFIDPVISAWQKNKTKLLEYKPDTLDITRTKFKKSKQINKTIGIVGLGKMGGNLARNLIKKNWQVVGYNRTKEVTKKLSKNFKPAILYSKSACFCLYKS